MKIYHKIISIIFFLALVSCSTMKNTERIKIKPIASKKLIKRVERNYLDYNTLKLKASTKVILDGKRYSLKASIRIQKDSLIWVYFMHSTGYPVANFLLSKDSVKFINKIEKEHFVGDYEFFDDRFGLALSYDIFQSFLTNEFFLFSDTSGLENIKFNRKVKADSLHYVINSVKKHKLKKRIRKVQKGKRDYMLISQKFYINPSNYKIEANKIENLNKPQSLSFTYSNFIEKAETLFPKKINVVLINESDTVNLNMKFTKIDLGKKLKFPFKISDKSTLIGS